MYSLVLMTVMAGSGDATAFGGRLSRGSCNGCHGVTAHYSSCTGDGGCTGASSCTGAGSCTGSSCQGSSCHGCTGSSCHGSRRFGGFLQRRGSSCHGSSCHGSCSGNITYGCSGCTGTGCTGGAAGHVHVGTATPGSVTVHVETTTRIGAGRKSANITVEVTPNAVLKVDGAVVVGTGAVRQFHTPDLAADTAYFYEMTAEVTVDGKTETQTRRVVVAAGQSVLTSFDIGAVKTVMK
jgi:uncharacterized protein (TIGR03000 family)